MFLAEELLKRYPDLLATPYGTKVGEVDAIGVVEGIAAKRGFASRAATTISRKRRTPCCSITASGILGRISLETPDTRAALMAQHAAEMAEKTAKRPRSLPRRRRMRHGASAGRND